MKAIKKTKAQLFQDLQSIQDAKFRTINELNHKAVQEAETLRELKQNLAYYHSMYECLGRQTGRQVNGFEGAKFFLGEMYFTSEKACKSNLIKLTAIAQFMGYELNKLTW
jgi:hypothetical protein